MWDFSLLHPRGDRQYFTLSDAAVNDLSLEFLIEHMAGKESEKGKLRKLFLQVPAERAVVEYRRSVYEDLKDAPELLEELRTILDEMEFYGTDRDVYLQRGATVWDFLCRLKDLENYCGSVVRIRDCLERYSFSSAALRELKEYIEEIYRDSGFRELVQDIEDVCAEVANVKSMTLGVNLDANMRPVSVGIVSMNSRPIREQGILERYLSFHGKKEELTMLAHSRKPDSDEMQLMNNLTRLIERMMPRFLKEIRQTLAKHVNVSGKAFVRLSDEVLFYDSFAKLEKKLKGIGMGTCMAEISEEDSSFAGFYNVRLALARADGLVSQNVVDNDITFEDRQKVMILTGPNRGGKTVFTQGIGLSWLFFMHGMFTPAKEAQLKPVDGIYTHFPADENETLDLGRLGEEAERFRKITELATENSLILFNESFATTSHTESLYIARDALKYLCCLGSLVIFNTHMHELAEDADMFGNTQNAKSRAVSAVMETREGERLYKIEYRKPEGQSFARDIALKYGITFEQLTKRTE